MPRIQSLTQQHFLERNASPMGSRMFSGMSGTSEGVPRMHPLKTNMGAAFKATSLIHGLRMSKPRIGMRMPRIGMGMPRLPKV